jgi:hypothetical protein
MGVDQAQFGPFANGAHPAVGRASVETLSVVAAQDWALGALSDGQVDGSGHSGDQGDQGRLVALPDDVKSPVPPIDAKILDVGATSLAHLEPVEAEQDTQGGVVAVVTLGGEEEGGEFSPIEPPSSRGVDLGPADVFGRVGADPAVDVSKR